MAATLMGPSPELLEVVRRLPPLMLGVVQRYEDRLRKLEADRWLWDHHLEVRALWEDGWPVRPPLDFRFWLDTLWDGGGLVELRLLRPKGMLLVEDQSKSSLWDWDGRPTRDRWCGPGRCIVILGDWTFAPHASADTPIIAKETT
jgi:hypothetical protein